MCIRWRHAAEGRRVKLTVSVTDEAEEWKEGDVFAWGDATLPWVGGWDRGEHDVGIHDR